MGADPVLGTSPESKIPPPEGWDLDVLLAQLVDPS